MLARRLARGTGGWVVLELDTQLASTSCRPNGRNVGTPAVLDCPACPVVHSPRPLEPSRHLSSSQTGRTDLWILPLPSRLHAIMRPTDTFHAKNKCMRPTWPCGGCRQVAPPRQARLSRAESPSARSTMPDASHVLPDRRASPLLGIAAAAPLLARPPLHLPAAQQQRHAQRPHPLLSAPPSSAAQTSIIPFSFTILACNPKQKDASFPHTALQQSHPLPY